MTMHELETIQLAENKRMCNVLSDAGDKSNTVRMIIHKLLNFRT